LPNNLRKSLIRNSIKILNIAKRIEETKELDNWEHILKQIWKSIIGISIKIIICHGMVLIPEIEKHKNIIEEAHRRMVDIKELL